MMQNASPCSADYSECLCDVVLQVFTSASTDTDYSECLQLAGITDYSERLWTARVCSADQSCCKVASDYSLSRFRCFYNPPGIFYHIATDYSERLLRLAPSFYACWAGLLITVNVNLRGTSPVTITDYSECLHNAASKVSTATCYWCLNYVNQRIQNTQA